MNSHLPKAFAVVLGGLLAGCASAPHAALSGSAVSSTQVANAQPTPTDAALTAGVVAPTASVCALIPEAEQSVCPLSRMPVVGTRQLVRPLDPKGYSMTPAGAVVFTLATPGLTPEWLGHVVECYRARAASQATATLAQDSCPLAEPGSEFTVSTTRDGFALAVRSPHSDAAKHIFEVSQRLVASNVPQRTALAVRQ